MCYLPYFTVGQGELVRGDGAAQRQLEREGRGAHDLGETLGRAVAGATEQLQIAALGGEPGAAAHRPDADRGHGEGGVQVAAILHFVVHQAQTILDDTGHVLPGGEVDRGEPVGDVHVESHDAGQLRGAGALGPPIHERLCGGANHATERLGRDHGTRDHLVAPPEQQGTGGGILIAVEVGLDQEAEGRAPIMLADVVAGRVTREGHHVLASRVRRVVDKVE